jgi:hypothetical protein
MKNSNWVIVGKWYKSRMYKDEREIIRLYSIHQEKVVKKSI